MKETPLGKEREKEEGRSGENRVLSVFAGCQDEENFEKGLVD